MSATIITLPKRPASPAPKFADPAMKRLKWAAYAWAKSGGADKATEAERKEALRDALLQPTPGEAEILKLLRRIDRKLSNRTKTGVS